MWDWKWVEKTVLDFIHTQGRAPELLGTILGKTLKDIKILFQIDQIGWEQYKYIIKNKEFQGICDSTEQLRYVKARECAIRLYSTMTCFAKNAEEKRKNDLTNFFSRIILQSGRM